MKKYSICCISIILFSMFLVVDAYPEIIEVDFLKLVGLNGNAQGPHILIADDVNCRIFAPCINSSSVAVIDARTDKVSVIPVSSRMPRRLRIQGAAVNHKNGMFYVSGESTLIIVDPVGRKSQSIPLPVDLPSVAVDEKTGNAFAVGRLAAELVVVKPGASRAQLIPYGHKEEEIVYFAVSAPTPVRTVWVDANSRRIYIIDGTIPRLYTLDADTFKILSARNLSLPPYPRWHWGGPDWEDRRFYLSIEDVNRNSRYAASIDLDKSNDIIVELPSGATEPTGVSISTERNELYIPYDNNDFIHVVSFTPSPRVEQIKHGAAYGIDSSTYDEGTGLLYAPTWAEGVMYEINVAERKVRHLTPYFPVYPHMNNFAYLPSLGKIYVPSGATAVNGTFGSLITVLDVNTLEQKSIYTGWSPVSLVQVPGQEKFFVFGSDDTFAAVTPDGTAEMKKVPHPYLHNAVARAGENQVFVAYGPHYSIFPVFYIKATRGGIYRLDSDGNLLAERQTDRLAQGILIDDAGIIWTTENTWGKENPNLVYFPPDASGKWGKVSLPPAVDNECALRGLKRDPFTGKLWVIRNGDRSNDKGFLHLVDPVEKKLLATYETGITPTDLAFLDGYAFISNFTDNTVSYVKTSASGFIDEKPSFIKAGKGPIALASSNDRNEVYVLNHKDSTLTILEKSSKGISVKKTIPVPGGFLPGNLYMDNAKCRLYISAHRSDKFALFAFNPVSQKFDTVIENSFHYGEVTFDQSNTAFANTAQWGDAVYRLNEFSTDSSGRLWVTDYLSGKLWIIK